MTRAEIYSIGFTIFQIWWAFIWARKHIQIRRLREYAQFRVLSDTNNRYKVVSYFLFISQNLLAISSVWTNYYLLAKFHNNNLIRLIGIIVTLVGTKLYFDSLNYLGKNYSPCFDSHLPLELVIAGPYKYIRHPMYLAKLLVGIGTFIISGSLLWLPMLIYLILEIIKTIWHEERHLSTSIPGYREYQQSTTMLIPFIV